MLKVPESLKTVVAFVRRHLTENFFVIAYTVVAIFVVRQFVTKEEGKANLYETLSLGLTREALFLVTVFTLIKMLQGIDVNLKEDLFKNAYTTTAFICSLVLGSAWMLMVR
jgi:hypothetical protein